MSKIRLATVCSGIGAPELAAAGFAEPVFFSEVDAFASAVLVARWPGVPNRGDMLGLTPADVRDVGLFVGGTPCQAFSVAGRREGLTDPRGALSLQYVELVHALDETAAAVWENVPGVLSDRGNAFGHFVAALCGLDDPLELPADRRSWPSEGLVAGPVRHVAWRVLDARHFGTPQRRRRVFLVALDPRAGCPGEVLALGHSEGGSGPEGAATRQASAGVARGRAGAVANDDRIGAFKQGQGPRAGGLGWSEQTAPTLIAGASGTQLAPAVVVGGRVRKMTPRECERLQGLPDDHTLVPWRGGWAPDSRRYSAIGNSMAVPVIEWVLERVRQQVCEAQTAELVAA